MGTGQGPADDDGLGTMAREMRRAQPYFAAVWQLVGGAVVGVLAGYWLDRRLGTTPWLLIGLSLVGIVAGFYGFLRTMLSLDKKK